MSVLEKFGNSMKEALRRISRASYIDETAIKDLVLNLQRDLLQADVNVKLVFELSELIQKRALEEKIPTGISRREHVINVLYEELTKFLGEKEEKINIKIGKNNVLMLVGIQGSGKTTSSAKIAKHFQKRGFKTALVCADTFRLGAFDQLAQLAEKESIPFFGNTNEKNAENLAYDGVQTFRKKNFDIILVDTAGRHKDEKNLIDEMKRISEKIEPDEIILVLDATLGQQAFAQAKAFNEATNIGSILLTKLDGSARGGGALSAVVSTGAHIKFISTGEKIDDFEVFIPSKFVGRILGMGDLEGLMQKVKDAKISVPDEKVKKILKGKMTLEDMFEQLDAIRKLGPLKQIMKMIPGFSLNIPEESLNLAEEKVKKWRYIMQSMTKNEKDDPKIINSSRIKRIATGSGSNEKDIKELIKQFFAMQKTIKSMGRRRFSQAFKKVFSNFQ